MATNIWEIAKADDKASGEEKRMSRQWTRLPSDGSAFELWRSNDGWWIEYMPQRRWAGYALSRPNECYVGEFARLSQAKAAADWTPEQIARLDAQRRADRQAILEQTRQQVMA